MGKPHGSQGAGDVASLKKTDGGIADTMSVFAGARVTDRCGRFAVIGFNESVGEEVVFDLFPANISKHHAIYLDAGGQLLAGPADHFGVVVAIRNDVFFLEREGIFFKDGTNATTPPTMGFHVS